MSHFGSHRRTGMLACASPSRPHTCVSGSPDRGGWGGQRSPLWATATGPGLFRSLGFKNPSGYWLFGGQHTAIQRVGRLGGAEGGGGGSRVPGPRRRSPRDQHDPDLMLASLSSTHRKWSAITNCFALALSQHKPDQHRMLP